METNRKYTWRQKVAQVSSIAFMSVAVLISCQKKNDSGTTYVAPVPFNQAGVVGNCVGCNFVQAQLGTPVSLGQVLGSQVSVQWNLIGDQTAVQQLLQYGYSAKMYSGPVALSGTMTTSTAIQFGSNNYGGYGGYGCQMPAGAYQINTVQAGQMAQGRFGTLQIQAVGAGVQIVFALTNAVVADPQGSGQITHIFGQLVPTAAVINGQQIACNDIGFYLSY